MTQHVTAKEWRNYTSPSGVLDDDVADRGRTAERFERHPRPQKDMSSTRVAWSPIAEITGHGFGDRRQQWQRERHAGLGAHELERGGAPVDVVHLKPNCFAGAAAINRSEEHTSELQ